MRLCASLFRRRRGPAGLRDLFRFCRSCGLYALRSGPFRVCEARGGITTLSALYVLLKRRTAACQKGYTYISRFSVNPTISAERKTPAKLLL